MAEKAECPEETVCDTWGWKLDENCDCVDKTSYVPECRNFFQLSGSYCTSDDGSNYEIKCKPMYSFDETMGSCQIMAEEEIADMRGAKPKRDKEGGRGGKDKGKRECPEGETCEKPEGEMGEGTRPEGGEGKPDGERPDGKPDGEKPDGKPDGERPDGKPDGEKPEGEKPEGEKPEGEKEEEENCNRKCRKEKAKREKEEAAAAAAAAEAEGEE